MIHLCHNLGGHSTGRDELTDDPMIATCTVCLRMVLVAGYVLQPDWEISKLTRILRERLAELEGRTL